MFIFNKIALHFTDFVDNLTVFYVLYRCMYVMIVIPIWF